MFSIRAKKRRDGFVLDVDIEVSSPGVVALFGRSGCGKTTLANIVAGLLPADEAHIVIDGVALEQHGKSLRAEHRRIGYVFQDARLFPHLDVMGNLRYGEKRATIGHWFSRTSGSIGGRICRASRSTWSRRCSASSRCCHAEFISCRAVNVSASRWGGRC